MAAHTYDLISLAEAKTHLGISDTAQDALLEALITGVSFAIEAYCQTAFVQRTVTDIMAGGLDFRRNEKTLYLTRYPIVSVISITDPAGNTVPAADYVIYAAEGMLVHAGAWPVAQDSNGNIARWSVVYVAGRYTNTLAVDADVKLACTLLVAARYSRREGDIASKSIGGGDFSISYRSAQAGESMPLEVTALLAAYRSYRV